MATTALLIILFIALFWLSYKMITKKKTAPEARGSWPIIGHLHLLGGSQPPHVVLANMADKYGPIFTIKMGVHRCLIVSNSEIAKECFTTNDLNFATRPNVLATVILGYDRSMFGFSPYGNYWRQIRKIATLQLLSNHRLEMFRHAREAEVGIFLKEMYQLWKNKKSETSEKVIVEMKRWFVDITLNLILKIIVGKSVGYETTRGKESEDWKQALRDFSHLSGIFVAADAVPFLRWLDIGGHEKAMKKTAEKLDVVVKEWLKEHKDKRACGGVKNGEEDFMYLMFDILDDEAQLRLDRDSDTINKATCMALTLAASDTTAVTLAWALSLLINNPIVLKKAQDELDTYVGRSRQVRESDVQNLVYLKAIIKETLRLYPPGPISIPHESIEECIVGGYHVPKGTRLFVNLSKIHRDPRVWPTPLEFQPERFLTCHRDIDIRGQNFELIPFGSGRRMCPGISFALQVLQLTLATVLHGFEFSSPTGDPVDMTESPGLTNPKATPLEVTINPRLQPHLYQI